VSPWARHWLIALGVALLVVVVATVLSVVTNTTFEEPAPTIHPLLPAFLVGALALSVIAAVRTSPRRRVFPLVVLPAGLAGIAAVSMWGVVDDPCPLSPGLGTNLNSVPPDPCAGVATLALTLAAFATAMLVTAAYRWHRERRPGQAAF
jgi:hypothetical protein